MKTFYKIRENKIFHIDFVFLFPRPERSTGGI